MDAVTNSDYILPNVQAITDEMVSFRHYLHSHPEISYQESQTSTLIANKLHEWGYEVHQGLAGTGIVATLTKGSSSKVIGLRADMDALPIDEQTGVTYCSQHQNTMHACGHDGHSASLLTAARVLAEEGQFDGSVRLIFQPAEEGIGGSGADKMIQEGLFDRFPCDAVYALHNMPGFPAGQFGFYPGALMASADTVLISLSGDGGHGAMPHKSRDPIVAGAALVGALQTIVARNVDPLESAVVSIGRFQSGNISNVIPERVEMDLSIRATSPATRQLLHERITELVQAHSSMYGLTGNVEFCEPYPVLVNSLKETEFARQVARDWVGEDGLIQALEPMMISEDFAYMLEQVPGSYFIIGNDDAENPNRALHHPEYDFNDRILPIAASFWIKLVQAYLTKSY